MSLRIALFIPVLLVVSSSLALTGCGNKGPLVQAPPKPAEEAPAKDEAPRTEGQPDPADFEDPAVNQEITEPLPPADPPAQTEPLQLPPPPANDGGG